jgi:hypothetical protein
LAADKRDIHKDDMEEYHDTCPEENLIMQSERGIGRKSAQKARVGVLYEKTGFRKRPTIIISLSPPLPIKGIRCSSLSHRWRLRRDYFDLYLSWKRHLFLVTPCPSFPFCSDIRVGSGHLAT